ncbi:hypothetical protein TRIP_C20028 [Candidatus Zixiibacteriota bacterium]|nr:hypothetical protein TRIP_C20028 [candidate division Zixibacteria bacterium]
MPIDKIDCPTTAQGSDHTALYLTLTQTPGAREKVARLLFLYLPASARPF